MNPSFENALNARLLWMQVRSLGALGFHRQAGEAAQEAYRLVSELAVHEAYCDAHSLGSSHYGEKAPHVLSDVSRLAELYEDEWLWEFRSLASEAEEERERREEACERLERREALERKKTHADECIGRSDWEALGLPSPEELSAVLYAGKSIRVEGHFLDYEDGVVWMDNPYGVEGCLGEEPTVILCRSFLVRVARGGMYGPEP